MNKFRHLSRTAFSSLALMLGMALAPPSLLMGGCECVGADCGCTIAGDASCCDSSSCNSSSCDSSNKDHAACDHPAVVARQDCCCSHHGPDSIGVSANNERLPENCQCSVSSTNPSTATNTSANASEFQSLSYAIVSELPSRSNAAGPRQLASDNSLAASGVPLRQLYCVWRL